MAEMAHAFAALAKPAGITIRVIQVPAQVYWSDYAGHVPFTGNWGFGPRFMKRLRLPTIQAPRATKQLAESRSSMH